MILGEDTLRLGDVYTKHCPNCDNNFSSDVLRPKACPLCGEKIFYNDYDRGYNSGYEDDYDRGYNSGYEDGYNQGKLDEIKAVSAWISNTEQSTISTYTSSMAVNTDKQGNIDIK